MTTGLSRAVAPALMLEREAEMAALEAMLGAARVWRRSAGCRRG